MAPLWLQCMGEFVGTMLLIILGNGACFSVNHKKMFANQSGRWVIVVLGWAIGIFVGAFVSQAIGGPGHINPAISLYASISQKSADPLALIPMQFLGAMIGEALLYFMNMNFIKDEIDMKDSLKTETRGSSCTNPAYDGTKGYVTNFTYELVGTSILVAVVMILGHVVFSGGLLTGTISMAGNTSIVALTVLGIGTSIGSATGFALNPARDLGPRIVYQILRSATGNKLASANWQYSWIPVAAPLLAGIIFGASALAF